MTRLLIALVGLAVSVPLMAAPAPVPKHLFPKDVPLCHPVQKGTTWVYEGDVSYTLVVTNADKDEKDGSMTVTIAKVLPDKRETLDQKLAVSQRGFRWLENSVGAYDNPVWMLKTPVRPGDEWAFSTSGPGIANTKGVMRVVGWEDIEVPAGKYSAVRVEQEATLLAGGKPTHDYQVTFWYSPDVGLVKWTCGGSGAVLKSFIPAK